MISQKQGNGNVPGDVIHDPFHVLPRFCGRKIKGTYNDIGVGLSALLVSTDRAMREPLHGGTSDRLGPTLWCLIT